MYIKRQGRVHVLIGDMNKHKRCHLEVLKSH